MGVRFGGRYQGETPNPGWGWKQKQESTLVPGDLSTGQGCHAGPQHRNPGGKWGSGRSLGCMNSQGLRPRAWHGSPAQQICSGHRQAGLKGRCETATEALQKSLGQVRKGCRNGGIGGWGGRDKAIWVITQ